MSLRPQPIPLVPDETARVARPAFPKGNLYLQMHDEVGALFSDAQFAALFPGGANLRKRPGDWPW